MNTEAALEFLRLHQPLQPTREVSNDLLSQFEAVRKHFTCDLDSRCVPLLIGALGEGDGHGIYQMVETTLLAYPEAVVVPALRLGLASSHGSVRYWSAQFAANYPNGDLLGLLVGVCRKGGIDERLAAVTAIEIIDTPESRERLRELLLLDLQPPVRKMIEQALE